MTNYTYGWNIVRESGLVDISDDVVKPFYNTDITRAHLDRNVL